ncbi:MAG: hypothetical protein P8O97_03205 [Gammaproteobacteria bacterium]|nr:hypothetical protein [Gammaproteobacteria bacterium]
MNLRRTRKETAAYSLSKRLASYFRSSTGVLLKRMDVSFVSLGKKQYKRITCIDNYTPIHMQDLLAQVARSRYFPKTLIRYENEIWVEFVDGDIVKKIDSFFIQQIIDFYSSLYQCASALKSSENFLGAALIDLEFLMDMELLSEQDHEQLRHLLLKNAPEKVWVGLDYTDALLKNFVQEKGSNRLVAIDIESLQDKRLIGFGLAKAHTTWMTDQQFDQVIEGMRMNETPAFYDYYLFVLLCFRARWLKSLFLRKKMKRLKINLLTDLITD